MNDAIRIQEPVLKWVGQRARYVKRADGLEWVVRDPVVGCLAPALYVLDKKNRLLLSESIRQAVTNIYFGNKALWVVREHRLKKILDNFERAEVPFIPLKGAILRSLLYKDSGLRSMGDIDILVRPGTLPMASKLLLQNGFKLHPDNGFESLAWLEELPASRWPGEIIFDDGQGLVIELHQNLVTYQWFVLAYPLVIEALWERSLPLSDEEKTSKLFGEGLWKRVLSPYDMLAHLCLHLALHGLWAMQSYLDIDLWIRSLPDTWDWGKFLELVNQWQIRSTTYHALSFCEHFMDTPLPDGILERLDPGWLARARLGLLISAESILADRRTLGRRYPTLVKLALIDRISRILATLVKLAFPGKAWRENNPSGRSLLAHWLHVWQVVRRGD